MNLANVSYRFTTCACVAVSSLPSASARLNHYKASAELADP